MRFRKIVLFMGGAAVALAGGAALVAGFSPYRERVQLGRSAILETVDVGVPCDELFAYLGDSRNASEWSVFVDHITPLNADAIPDGEQGSIRRSFRSADERGMRWDELFIRVEAPAHRRLRIFDVTGAPLQAGGTLVTDQIYEPVAPDRCRLSFTLWFEDEASLADRVKMTVGAYRIARIFRSNIENVKRLTEAAAAGDPAVR